MNFGDTVKINAAVMMNGVLTGIKKITCKVCGRYKGFVLLDTGKYKVCAFVNDIIKQRPIYI